MNKLESLQRKKKVLECFNHVLSKSSVDDREYQIEVAFRYYRRFFSHYGHLKKWTFQNITYRKKIPDLNVKIKNEVVFINKVNRLKKDNSINSMSKQTGRSRNKIRSVL